MSNIEIEKFDDRVEKYLRGQMSEYEERDFKEELEGSQELKERAAMIAMTIKAIHEIHERDAKILGELKNMTKDDLEQLIADVADVDELESELVLESAAYEIPLYPEFEDKVVIKRMPYLRYAACFVAIVILIGGGLQGFSSITDVNIGNDNLLYKEHTLALGNVKSRGAETDSMEKDLYSLFNKVQDGSDLKETTKQLETLYEMALNGDEAYKLYEDDIAWNLAFANLKRGHGRKAKKYLRDIIQRGQNADAAQELMGRTKSLVF